MLQRKFISALVFFVFCGLASGQFRAFPGTPLDARSDFPIVKVWGACLSDVNEDGLLDYITVGSRYWDVNRWVDSAPGVWLGRKNFGFQNVSKSYRQPSFLSWVNQAGKKSILPVAYPFPHWDINGDGKGDFFSLSQSSQANVSYNNYAYVYSKSLPKRFSLKTKILVCPNALRYTMLQGDFNGDGHQDIYVLRWLPNTSTYTPYLGLWKKPGVFVDVSQTAFPQGLPYKQKGFRQAAIDLEGDGDLDLLFFPIDEPDFTPIVLENNGKAQFKMVKKKFPPFTAKIAGTWGGTAADLDGDGDQDLAICTFLPPWKMWNSTIPPPSRIWWNDGKGNFTWQTILRVPVRWGQTRPPFVFDYDLDGDLDLVYPQWWGGNNRINTVPIENKGKHVFVEHMNGLQPLSEQDPFFWGIVLDLDHDGDLDLFTYVLTASGNRYFFNTHHQLCVPKDPVLGKPFRADYFVKPGPRFLLAFVGWKLLPQGLSFPKYGKWWLEPFSMMLVKRIFCNGPQEEHLVDLPIPNLPSLVGLKIYSQGLVLDLPTREFWATTFFENTVKGK